MRVDEKLKFWATGIKLGVEGRMRIIVTIQYNIVGLEDISSRSEQSEIKQFKKKRRMKFKIDVLEDSPT